MNINISTLQTRAFKAKKKVGNDAKAADRREAGLGLEPASGRALSSSFHHEPMGPSFNCDIPVLIFDIHHVYAKTVSLIFH